jgi:hypothetical protein
MGTRRQHLRSVETRSAQGSASFQAISADRKLAPVTYVPGGARPRPRSSPPYACSTYASISATCSDGCPFKARGCYVRSGFTQWMARRLDENAQGVGALDVIREEIALIDGAFRGGMIPQDGGRDAHRGRDLRIHNGGDIPSGEAAVLIADSARRWRARGGGTPFTYSHLWREIPRAAFGDALTVLASVERAEDIEEARQAGYPSAIVVSKFPSPRAFGLSGSTARVVPCPAETNIDPNKRVTCATCRLCLDRDLLKMNVAIAFELHGHQAGRVREKLELLQVRRSKDGARVGGGGPRVRVAMAVVAGDPGADSGVGPSNRQSASRGDDAESGIRSGAHLTEALQLLKHDVRGPVVPTYELPQLSSQLTRRLRALRSVPVWTKTDLEFVKSIIGNRERGRKVRTNSPTRSSSKQ